MDTGQHMTQFSNSERHRRRIFAEADPPGAAAAPGDALVRRDSTALTPVERTDADLQFAALPQVQPDRPRDDIPRILLRDFFRPDPAGKAFDLLRTRLLQTLRSNGWSRIAIAAPTAGCGATFTAVNLAESLARIPGNRIVLMDMNQRDPGVGEAFGLAGGGELREFLAGRVGLTDYLARIGDTLAIGQAHKVKSGAAEMLHDPRSGDVLNRMTATLRPDVVLYDFPPMLECDDLAAFLPQLDGVLLVTDGTRTLAREIEACERILEGQCRLIGVILNRGRIKSR